MIQLWEFVIMRRGKPHRSYEIFTVDTSGNLDELMAEISALRNTLSQQSDFVSNLEGSPGGRGFWYYVPSPPNVRHLLP